MKENETSSRALAVTAAALSDKKVRVLPLIMTKAVYLRGSRPVTGNGADSVALPPAGRHIKKRKGFK